MRPQGAAGRRWDGRIVRLAASQLVSASGLGSVARRGLSVSSGATPLVVWRYECGLEMKWSESSRLRLAREASETPTCWGWGAAKAGPGAGRCTADETSSDEMVSDGGRRLRQRWVWSARW